MGVLQGVILACLHSHEGTRETLCQVDRELLYRSGNGRDYAVSMIMSAFSRHTSLQHASRATPLTRSPSTIPLRHSLYAGCVLVSRKSEMMVGSLILAAQRIPFLEN